MKSISDIRKEYLLSTLDEKTINKNPIEQFKKWMNESLECSVLEPTAMTLSTVSKQGRPTSRVVLLKEIDGNNFVFYTNLQSSKGKEMLENPYCCLNFFWPELERQVRIEGKAKVIADEKSNVYFKSRPRESQIGAWVSNQSSKIADRLTLENKFKETEKKFHAQSEINKPEQWGGFEVSPFKIEFWQGRQSRLHDRILFTQVNKSWEICRLAP